jgi:hypothetical protein
MPFYSFKVKSPEETLIPSRQLAIGEGLDVFNKVIDDLPSFLSELNDLGVEVIECNQLDNLEAVQPNLATFSDRLDESVLLPAGEQPE